MFAAFTSSKEKSIIKVMLMKTKLKNKFYLVYRLVNFLAQSMSLDSFLYEPLWFPVDQNFLWRGSAFAISCTPFLWSELSDFRWVSDQNAALLLPLGRANISQQKNKKNKARQFVPD